MKRTRYISLIIALLSVLGLAAQQQQSQYALYNYRNDGDFNAWLNIDVDSITYSNIGLDSVEYDNIVTQEVWTPDSCYRIPLEVIDSIGFRAPAPIMREGIFYLRDYHAEYTVSIDSLTIYFDESILPDSVPSIGQPILCATQMTPYEEGFAGKAKDIRNADGKIVVECEMLCVADVYKRLVMAGRAITETEAINNARARAKVSDGEPWVKYEDSDVIIEDLGDIKLKILDGLFFANSIKPTLQVNYYVYVDEDIYDMSATIRLTHTDLEYGVDLNLNKLLDIDDDESADKESKDIAQALLRMRNYKSMSQEDWVNSIVEEVKQKGEKEKLDADQAGLLKGMWKKMHKEWEIPIGGPFTLGLEIGPLLDLKGSVDIQGKAKTKARNTIFIEAKGYTTATLTNPTLALATGLAEINGYSDFHIEPIQSLSVGISAKGSLDVGFFGKASLNLIHKSVVHASGSIKAGLKLAGEISYTWDSETWHEEDFSQLTDPLYDGVKNTKVKLEAFSNLGLEVGITPWKFLTAGAEFELGKADLGSCYLFPHFTQPALPTYDYEKNQWSNGNSNNHLVLESSPSKNIPDFLLGPCKIGMKIIDENGVCVKESDEREYRDDGTIVWGLFPLSIDFTGLTPGSTYRCFPVLRYHDWWQLRATPSYEFTMPEPMTLGKDALTLPKNKTTYVAINGGWGDYSASSSSKLVCTAEIVMNNDQPYVKIDSKRVVSPATVTVKDLRAGTTETILVTVSGDESPMICPDDNHPHLIDLGLPSGTKWSCCNVGASQPEAYGYYYQWGETTPVQDGENCGWNNSYAPGGVTFTGTSYRDCCTAKDPMYVDGTIYQDADGQWTCNISGNAKYDAATANWGASWRMFTDEELNELYMNCTFETASRNGVSGCEVKSNINNNVIFFPAAGCRYATDTYRAGSFGSYWLPTLWGGTSCYPNGWYFGSDEDEWQDDMRCCGRTVRPVSTAAPVTLALSESSVTISQGNTTTVDITSGSGNYSVSSSNASKATATVEGNIISIIGKAVGAATITVTDTQTHQTATVEVTVTSGTTPDPGNHAWVDLGLPSGTKWATCNVGASSPEEYGDYFAWGETEPKDYYDWSTYKWCNGSYDTMTKYCIHSDFGYNGFTDGLTELLPEDDAATANWGSPWHMPTYEQIEELLDNCTREWTTRGGVNGTLVTGPNGNTIFLPAAGNRWLEDLYYAGSLGYYWSSSLYTSYSDSAYNLDFSSGYWGWYYYYGRDYGQSVRAVRP